ncbi:general secretion pathway protein J [Pseudoduganella lurida]|uniref:General secretion pathway protein J n=1 Tax=Pseudoduganella lurida TaxID=1036180 RepID=A0A562R1Z2_9BURK|nr:prepilin-type N-terminal cleavage/methylation domain-containing protein [Pseudoduganella lurida]TWI63092.1 general secretion pathway protein J [Pseudoduganella lurida]
MKPRAALSGFTLVELLVAITVLAIVAVLGWRGLDSIVRSRVMLTAQMEHTRGIQLAFAQMQNDLEQMAGADLVGTRQYLAADNARLLFVRTVAAENAATQLVVVSYRVRDGVLTRRESPGTRDLAQLQALWQVAMSDGDPVPGVALQRGVAGMTVRVWRDGAWQPAGSGTSSTTSTGSTSTGSTSTGGTGSGATGTAVTTATAADLPEGLEMSLQLQGENAPLVKVLLVGAT